METTVRGVAKPLIIVASSIIVLGGMKAANSFLGPVLLGVVFATILSPIPAWLAGRGVPRWLAVTAGFVAFLLVILFLATLLSLAVNEIGQILSQSAGAIQANGEALVPSVPELAPARLMDVAAAFAKATASLLASLLLTTVVFVFALAEGPSLIRRTRAQFGSGHPLPLRIRGATTLTVRYIGLRTIVNLFTGAGIFLLCLVMKIPNALLWGLLVFVLSYIPYIGIFVACVPPALLALAASTQSFVIFVSLSILINGIAEQAVAPLITGKGLRISPILIFLAFFFWGYLLGGPGYLLAVPMTVYVLLFFGAFDDTRGLVGLFSNLPLPEAAAPGN